MPPTGEIAPIVNAFPTNRAGIIWTITVAVLFASIGYFVGNTVGGARVAALEDRLKVAQESRSSYQIRIAEVTSENPYRVQPTDDLVQISLADGTAPLVLLPSGFVKGKTISVKDKKGNSSKQEIIIRAEGGTIDGLAEWRIAGDYASANFVWDGRGWSAF
jgi:hypothetical protein